jgi:hypothetical protein
VTPGGTQLPAANEITGGLLEGGMVWLDRIIQAALAPLRSRLVRSWPVCSPPCLACVPSR